MAEPAESVADDSKAEFKAGFAAYSQGDYATALAKWKPLAENGAAQAQVNLGIIYAKGEGVEQSHEEALRWYKLAADQDHGKALFNIGVMYENGTGVEQSHAEAVRHYAAAVLLPAAAFVYTLMTVDSALRHWRGEGGRWKGRRAPG